MRKKTSSSKRTLSVLALSVCFCLSLSAQTGTSEAWTTNSSKRMEHQAEQALEKSSKASVCINLYPEDTFQQIDGFGWMLTQGSARLLMQLPADKRHAVLEELFATDQLNASMVRVAIGACDLSDSDYTYSASQDETLSNFAIAEQDLTTVIPVLQEILSINPNVKVLAVPWTAPVWMKENTIGNNGYSGGTLKTAYYNLYALYFCKYIETMVSLGIPVWGVSVQNEPLNSYNNPSMTWTKEAMYKFIAGSLGPKLNDNGHGDVHIIAYDHNCDVTDFPVYVAKSKYVYGTAFHLYAGDISALSTVHSTTGKPVLFTEQYTGKDGSFAGDLNWHMLNVAIGALNNMSTTVIEWNLCSDPDCSIHTSGGCSTCKGALTINGSSLTSRNVSYFIISHVSRVIDPEAVRIKAVSSASGLAYTAALNPDGTTGVVVYNDTDQNRSLSIALPDSNGQTVFASHTIPAKGVLSVRIRPDTRTALDNTTAPARTTKHIENGQLVIEHNGQRLNVLGQMVNYTNKW